MAQPLVQPREDVYLRSRRFRNNSAKGNSSQRIDASTYASKLQLQEERFELTCSLIALFLKSGLLVIALASSFKLVAASHQRVTRNNEIAQVLEVETENLDKLYLRFDSLFAIGGKERLLEEQDQLISPGSKRIIWR